MLTPPKLTTGEDFGKLGLTIFKQEKVKGMQDTYKIGRRFRKLKYICVVVNSLIVGVFYFVYRYLLEGVFPEFAQVPLALIFCALIVCVARITMWAADKYAAAITYTVKKDGLLYRVKDRERFYPWKDFSSVRLQGAYFQGVFPVEFQVGGEKLVLNQHIDGIYRLTGEIFHRIGDHVAVDPALVKQAEEMEGVY